MAIGFEDEFDYLEEHEDSEDSKESKEMPKIRGAKQAKEKEAEEKEAKDQEKKEQEKKELEKIEEKEEKKDYNSVIYTVKVTTNKEDKAFELIAEKINKKNINVYSLIRPHGLKGYIFIESPDKENAEEAVFNLPYVKRLLPQIVKYDDIKSMLEPVAAEVNIEKNDIVEIISEPFKKEKAKVVRIDKGKGEAIVSLLGAAVPIPVTVKLDNIRVIRRDEEEL